jgi:hypothetical protein
MRVMSAGDGDKYLLQFVAACSGRAVTVTGDPLVPPYFRHKTVGKRVATRVEHLDPELSADERAATVESIEAEEPERGTRRTVAGYDYTVSVPKSVSALWAVADAAMQAAVVEARHQAVADVIALMERDVAATPQSGSCRGGRTGRQHGRRTAKGRRR